MNSGAREGSSLTDRQVLALAGVFYVLAFPLYGGGQFLLQSGQSLVGLGLVLMNSAVVIAIGFLLKPIIERSSQKVAATVFWGRLIEGIVLGSGAIAYLITNGSQTGEYLNEAAYHSAMIILGGAGVIFSVWLFKARRVPPVLAVFGVVAYVSLVTAMVLERVGQDSPSMWFLAVAGLFEILFALWLILRGFRPVVSSPAT
jgi:hypothetical protein